MFKIIRYIDNLGSHVWTVIAYADNEIDAEHARDFFEANWPWEESEVQGRVYYSYEVQRG
jgi:hypothetical protein